MILFFGSKKLLTDFYNVSGTHGDQHVALGKIFVQIVFDFRKGWEIFAGSAEFYNALLDIFGGDAERIGFSGCVNIGENHMVCQGKSGGEIIEQRFRSGVGMRLENTPHFFMRIILCCCQCCPDLGRMMCIIIYDCLLYTSPSPRD